MTTYKPNGADLVKLQSMASAIKTGNAQLASAKKAVDGAKENLSQWLLAERGVDIGADGFAIGEIVNIEAICLIEAGKQTRFDAAKFQLDAPELWQRYQREFKTLKFKPLV
jgi:hypothetical protein